MVLDGKIAEEITNAMKSAFTTKKDFEMMLYHKLNIPNADVPNHPNLVHIISDVVKKFDCENRLEELIEGALKENPNNTNLQKVNETYKKEAFYKGK